MLKLFLLVTFVLFGLQNAKAQCVPDSNYTEPGIYPLTSAEFPKACVGNYFETVITNIVPVDTTISVFGIPSTLLVDSVVVASVTGLPSSMTYECNSTLGGCTFLGGEIGCVLLYGTPVQSEIGLYNPIITLEVYIQGLPGPSSIEVIDHYNVVIYPQGGCSVGLDNKIIPALSIYPNPVNNMLKVVGLTRVNSIYLFDLNGQLILQYDNVEDEEFMINVEHLKSGFYFLKVDNGESVETSRFLIRD